MAEETDDFMKELEGGEHIQASPEVKTKVAPSNQIVMEKEAPKEQITGAKKVPGLIGDDYPPEFKRITERIQFQYYTLPTLDYDAIYKEISFLTIKSSPTPTLQVLNDELYKVQSAKDRLAELLIDVIKCYNFKKRAVDILKDAWGKFSSEKNTESRKGDASFRVSEFLIDFAETEALSKACDHIFKNLDGLHDNLSRRITVWQLILKLRDVGRGALPDFDFDRSSTPADMFGEGGDKNKDDEGNIIERNF